MNWKTNDTPNRVLRRNNFMGQPCVMFCGINEAECYRASPSASTDERAARSFSARGLFRAQTFSEKNLKCSARSRHIKVGEVPPAWRMLWPFLSQSNS
jgi:hypothetical protein